MKEIVLTPEELFFLARKMKAKYLDYEYLALMRDVQNESDVKEIKAMESLSSKSYLEEDFEGEIEIDEVVAKTLNPVFFGKIETLLKKQDSTKLHILDDSITECTKGENELSFKNIDSAVLNSLLTGDLELQCANVDKGTYIRRYTSAELEDSTIKAEVMKIAIGEW